MVGPAALCTHSSSLWGVLPAQKYNLAKASWKFSVQNTFWQITRALELARFLHLKFLLSSENISFQVARQKNHSATKWIRNNFQFSAARLKFARLNSPSSQGLRQHTTCDKKKEIWWSYSSDACLWRNLVYSKKLRHKTLNHTYCHGSLKINRLFLRLKFSAVQIVIKCRNVLWGIINKKTHN